MVLQMLLFVFASSHKRPTGLCWIGNCWQCHVQMTFVLKYFEWEEVRKRYLHTCLYVDRRKCLFDWVLNFRKIKKDKTLSFLQAIGANTILSQSSDKRFSKPGLIIGTMESPEIPPPSPRKTWIDKYILKASTLKSVKIWRLCCLLPWYGQLHRGWCMLYRDFGNATRNSYICDTTS